MCWKRPPAALQTQPPIGAINAYLDGLYFYDGNVEDAAPFPLWLTVDLRFQVTRLRVFIASSRIEDLMRTYVRLRTETQRARVVLSLPACASSFSKSACA